MDLSEQVGKAMDQLQAIEECVEELKYEVAKISKKVEEIWQESCGEKSFVIQQQTLQGPDKEGKVPMVSQEFRTIIGASPVSMELAVADLNAKVAKLNKWNVDNLQYENGRVFKAKALLTR